MREIEEKNGILIIKSDENVSDVELLRAEFCQQLEHDDFEAQDGEVVEIKIERV